MQTQAISATEYLYTSTVPIKGNPGSRSASTTMFGSNYGLPDTGAVRSFDGTTRGELGQSWRAGLAFCGSELYLLCACW